MRIVKFGSGPAILTGFSFDRETFEAFKKMTAHGDRSATIRRLINEEAKRLARKETHKAKAEAKAAQSAEIGG